MIREIIIDGKKFTFTAGTDEQFVCKEVLIDWCYEFDFKPDDVILNLGGHIGSFDVYAFDKVKKIITFEPSKKNFDRLQYHLNINNITNSEIINGAINTYNGKCEFNICEQSGHNSLFTPEHNNYTKVEVNCYDIKDYLDKVTKIKCDIEGGEYILIGLIIPEKINEMYFELHRFNKEQEVMCDNLIEGFKQQGFNCIIYKNDEPNNRTYILHCKR